MQKNDNIHKILNLWSFILITLFGPLLSGPSPFTSLLITLPLPPLHLTWCFIMLPRYLEGDKERKIYFEKCSGMASNKKKKHHIFKSFKNNPF